MQPVDARVPKVSDEAPDLELLDEQRKPIYLSELWAKKPLVLLFYRGDWSTGCRRHLLAWRDEMLAFHKAGAAVAALSVDEPAVSAFFRAERGLPFPLLCDTSRAATEAFGLLDRTPQGGIAHPATFVIDRAGRIRSRSIDSDERRVQPHELLLFLKRGGASGARPLRARISRAVNKLRVFEHQLIAGLRSSGARKA